MPVRSDPATATKRWAAGMSGSAEAMKRGVQALQTSPGQSAAAAVDKWLTNTTNARDKYVRRNQGYTLGDWQSAMNSYGISRVATGAQQKQGKFQSFMSEFLPFLSTGVAQIHSMPKNTIEDSIARASAMIRYNHGFQRGSGGMG